MPQHEPEVLDAVRRRTMGAAARRDIEERYDARKNILRSVGIMRGALGLAPSAS